MLPSAACGGNFHCNHRPAPLKEEPIDLDVQKEQLMEVTGKSDEFRLKRAYCCFAFLGLTTLPLGLARFSKTREKRATHS
jgi:hypothetical protein